MRYVVLLIAVGWSLWFPIHVFFTLQNNPVIMRGPSNDIMQTTGVFEPSGYIAFNVKTNIKSLNGFHHTKIKFEPVLNSYLIDQQVDWPAVQKEAELGWPWGPSIIAGGATGSIEKIAFITNLEIPDDTQLAGQNVQIKIFANITYPRHNPDMMTFSNVSTNIEENFEIPIGAENPERLSAWSRYWGERKQHGSPYWPVIVWVWLLPVFWYGYVLVKSKSKANGRTPHIIYPGRPGVYQQQPNKPYVPKKTQEKEVIIKKNLCLKCKKRNSNECPYGKDTQCTACYDFVGIENSDNQ